MLRKLSDKQDLSSIMDNSVMSFDYLPRKLSIRSDVI